MLYIEFMSKFLVKSLIKISQKKTTKFQRTTIDMMATLSLLCFALLFIATSGFQHAGVRMGRAGSPLRLQQRTRGLALTAWDPASDPLDSSEIETGSSTSLAEKRRAEQLAREREEELARAAAAAALKASTQVASSTLPTTPAAPSSANVANGMSTAQGLAGQTFDFGLLIAFPVIIGTLALFFIFPLIKDQIGSSLPPVPLD
jgi:hypothetical protein